MATQCTWTMHSAPDAAPRYAGSSSSVFFSAPTRQLLLSLMQNGSKEADLKKAFFNECGLDNDEARRKAYYRARKTAMSAGHFEVSEGYILTRKVSK